MVERDTDMNSPESKLSKYERWNIIISAFVGISGILVTASIGIVTLWIAYHQIDIQKRIGQIQEQMAKDQQLLQEKIAAKEREVTKEQTRIIKEGGKDALEGNIVQTFGPYIDKLVKGDPKESCAARTILTQFSIYMSNEHGRDNLRELLGLLLGPDGFDLSICDQPEIAKKAPVANPLQFAEATKPIIKTTKVEHWFTVLGSYAISPIGLKQAIEQINKLRVPVNKFSKQQNRKLILEIYQTKISRNYAVTIGGTQSSIEAKSLAIEARQQGWAHDAFAQPNRDWMLYNETNNRFQIFLHLGNVKSRPVPAEDVIVQELMLKGFNIAGVDSNFDEYGPGVDYFNDADQDGAEKVVRSLNSFMPKGATLFTKRKQAGPQKRGVLGVWF